MQTVRTYSNGEAWHWFQYTRAGELLLVMDKAKGGGDTGKNQYGATGSKKVPVANEITLAEQGITKKQSSAGSNPCFQKRYVELFATSDWYKG